MPDNMLKTSRMPDKLMDRCGLFGVYNNDDFDTAKMIYYGLFSLQHRGVEAAGICTHDGGLFKYKRDKGMVTDIFDALSLGTLRGWMGIGHVLRFAGQDAVENAQPIVIRYTKGQMAVALNGGLNNTEALRHELELQGAVFQTLEAAEVISVLISRARNTHSTIEAAIADVMPKLQGGYALLVMTPRKVIGVRDPKGIRPLMLGRKGDSWFFSSETCAFDELGIDFCREVAPGEIVVVEKDSIHSVFGVKPSGRQAICLFEYICHSRPDSRLSGVEVFKARYHMGQEMAELSPANVDAVVWVPDSGLAAAYGYADGLGVPLADAFIKNRYYNNKFVKPDEAMAAEGIHMKFSAITSRVAGKRIAVVDDSMIHGTTARFFVSTLKNAGAREVHLRICSPLVRYLCHYGAAAPDRRIMSDTETDEAQICAVTGADSVKFLTVEALIRACAGDGSGFCSACFDGNEPV